MSGAPVEGFRNRKGERGTTITEAAFVTIPFFLIIFGIMEMGFLFRNYLTIGNTAAEAARAAAVNGNQPDADFQILRSAEHGIAALGVENLDYLVIWRATGPDDTVPDECRKGNVGTQFHNSRGRSTDQDPVPAVDVDTSDRECNLYLPGDFSFNFTDPISGAETVNFGCKNEADNIDWGWCPLVRQDSLSANGGTGPDYVGVYVQTQHKYLTGFFQSTSTLGSQKIVRIEPEEN